MTMFIDGKERTAKKGQGGYMYFWLSDGSYIKEHRAVMEQHLGRKLSCDEHVHHIDGDRTNNDISNLVILSRGEHSRIHRKEEYNNGIVPFANSNEKRKRKIVGVNDGGDVLRFGSFAEAREHGFNHAVDCCKGKRKSDKGYRWRYDD